MVIRRPSRGSGSAAPGGTGHTAPPSPPGRRTWWWCGGASPRLKRFLARVELPPQWRKPAGALGALALALVKGSCAPRCDARLRRVSLPAWLGAGRRACTRWERPSVCQSSSSLFVADAHTGARRARGSRGSPPAPAGGLLPPPVCVGARGDPAAWDVGVVLGCAPPSRRARRGAWWRGGSLVSRGRQGPRSGPVSRDRVSRRDRRAGQGPRSRSRGGAPPGKLGGLRERVGETIARSVPVGRRRVRARCVGTTARDREGSAPRGPARPAEARRSASGAVRRPRSAGFQAIRRRRCPPGARSDRGCAPVRVCVSRSWLWLLPSAVVLVAAARVPADVQEPVQQGWSGQGRPVRGRGGDLALPEGDD